MLSRRGSCLQRTERGESPPGRVIMQAVESLIWAGLLGAGLASVAGVRAFVPLALFALFAQLGLIVAPDFLGLQSGWTVVSAFSALAVIEIILDKVRALEPAFRYIMIPIRVVS